MVREFTLFRCGRKRRMSENFCLMYGNGIKVIAEFDIIAQISRDLIEEGQFIKPRLYRE